MSPLTILLFFIYTWGLGFTIARFVKESDNIFERNFMRVGFGLAVLPILIVILSWLRIPLDWRIFLALSMIYPVLYFLTNKAAFRNIKITISKSNINILIILLLFAFTFFMYHKGAFVYPYLEDDDSWEHAYAAKYVSKEKTVFEPINGENTFRYMDAYPPAYPALVGILHQTSPSLSWTLKFFNALIISLSIIFFYFFVKEFTGNKNKALFSTFVLAMIPCYLSHFIWAHAYVVVMIFPLFYCLERIKYDKKWLYLAIILITSTWLIELTESVKITLLIGIYWFSKLIIERKLNKEIIIAEISALVTAFIVWWGPMILKYGNNLLTLGLNQYSSSVFKTGAKKSYLGFIGSAGRLYTFNDFFVAKHQNMINNPVGVGVIVCLLLGISLIYLALMYKKVIQKKEPWILISLLWLLFTFLGIHGGTRFPIAFWSFRFWMLFAIPASILVGDTIHLLVQYARAIEKQIKIKHIISLALSLLLIFGIWETSGSQKYSVNTAIWGPGQALVSKNLIDGSLWLKQSLPVNTKVFSFSSVFAFMLYGLDKDGCSWCSDEIQFRENPINNTASDIHRFLKSKNYPYAVIDAYYVEQHGINETNNFISTLITSGLFQPVHQTQTMLTFKVI